MEGDGGGPRACLGGQKDSSLVCLRLFRGIFMGTQLRISDSCGVSDPFLLGIYMHVNKYINKESQPLMPGTRLGDLPQRRVETQMIPDEVPVCWEGQRTGPWV